MEYLNGGDLYSMLRNLGCLDEDMARVYIAELVSILAFIVSLIYFVLFYFILS
jgi:serine/threonine protein kinase